jgi:hypothetical protein
MERGRAEVSRFVERLTSMVPPGYWRWHVCKEFSINTGSPRWRGSGPQPDAREGQAGLAGVADRLVVPMKPGNAGGGKGPELKENVRRSEGKEIGDESINSG